MTSGLYSPSTYEEVSCTLLYSGEYSPTFVIEATISREGDYLYAPSLYSFVVADLQLYDNPLANTSNAILKRGLADGSAYIYLDGFDAAQHSNNLTIKNQRDFIHPVGFDTDCTQSNHTVINTREYITQVNKDSLYFHKVSATLLSNEYPPLTTQLTTLRLYGSFLGVGYPLIVEDGVARVSPPSINYPRIKNNHEILNNQSFLVLDGFSATTYGRVDIVNSRQYLLAKSGFNSEEYGDAYVQGGVKYVNPIGISVLALGRTVVINTTVDQYAKTTGIPVIPFPKPSVSPRSVRAFGILGTWFGSPKVDFPPRAKGWLSSAFGYPAIEDKTKYLSAGGIGADDQYGYPVVFDPTIQILVSSVIQSGVFGDTAVKNNRFVLNAEGIDSASVSPWATLRNTRRLTYTSGWHSLDFGESSVANKTPSIAPAGFDALRLPNAAEIGIGYAVRLIYTSGINKSGIGVATLTKTPEIAPKGIAAPALGLTNVWHRVRTLEVQGADAYKSGSADVWFRYRFVQLQDRGWNGSAYGLPKLEHEHRTINALGADSLRAGTPYIGLRNRTVAPKSVWENFATGHMVGGLRFILPVGYVATRFGSRIIPEITQAYPKGFANSYGLASIRNKTSLLLPDSITTTKDPVDQWGKAKVWNTRQYVTQFYDVDSALNPPNWSQWTLVENRNKYLAATGNSMLRVGGAVIANTALVVNPKTILAPAWSQSGNSGMVAFRIRPLNLDSIEPPYFSGWLNIYNDAAVLGSKGFNAESFGVSVVENTRRTFSFQGFDSAWFGYPMVADRIRNINIESRYGIAPPIIRMPEIKLYTRYLDPIGYETYGSGAQSLSIHWTLITPRWTHRDLLGEPRVHNVTPELRTRGRNSEEFGNTFVRLEWREVITGETFTQIIPRPTIAYRDRSIDLRGIQAMIVSDKLVVTKTGAPPYSEQTISLESTMNFISGEWNDDGHGIPIPDGDTDGEKQVPKPIINQQVLYHESDEPMTRYGSARVTANTVRVEPGLQELSVGDPMVSLFIRTLEVGEFPKNQVYDPSKPRLSPHTIYAPSEGSQQAKINHPTNSSPGPHFVDKYINKGFGRVVVSLRNRFIQHHHNQYNAYGDMQSFGRAESFNRRHYISPSSFSSFRSGWHTVPGDQESEQMPTAVTLAFGTASVAFPPYVGPLTIYQSGFNSAAIGRGLIEFRDRPIYPKGYLAEQIGTRKSGDKPYMWQGLRVGELMPTIPNGFASEEFGEPWISFRVREVNPDGYDAFICDYDLTAFSKRMKVFRKEVPNNVDHIKPEGFDAFASSASDVKPLAHFIRPDGNSDQYRKGAF